MAGDAVPKELFCYWHQGWDRAPDLVRRCAATWPAHNPSWNVHFLDRKSVEKVSIPRAAKALNLPLPAFSDVVRICLLVRGGMGGRYRLVRTAVGRLAPARVPACGILRL